MFLANHWKSLFDHLSVSVLLVDHELRCVYANTAAQQLLKHSERNLAERNMEPILGTELCADLRHALRLHQGFTQRDSSIWLDNKSVPVDISVSPTTGELDGHVVIEMQWTEHLSRLRKETHLLAGEVGSRELARGLAHEIKNPLGGIRGAAQLLAPELDDEQRELTGVIIDEVDRLTRLVDRLKGIQTKPKREALNIHTVLERTGKLVEGEYGHTLSLVRDYDPSLPEVLGDAEQLMQAVLNIAKNAVEAMVESGTPNPQLVLGTRIVRQVVLAGIPHKLAIRATIKDNGPGVSRDLQDTLFMPMVSGRAQGSGLGLAIAQQIVTRHQGLVEFESKPGATEFVITLPIERRAYKRD